MSEIKLDRKNMTNNLDEYQDWIEYCLNVMKDEIQKLEKVGVRRIQNHTDYSYGVAGGLKMAMGIITGEVERCQRY